MSDEDCEEKDLRFACAIKLNLSKNVITNIHGISIAKELYAKLEAMY